MARKAKEGIGCDRIPAKPTIKQPYLNSGSPLTETPSSHDAHPNCRESLSGRGPSAPRSPRCVLPPLDPLLPSPFDQRRVTLARTLARDRVGQSDETLASLSTQDWSMDRGSSAKGCCACYHGPETVDWPRGCFPRGIGRDKRVIFLVSFISPAFRRLQTLTCWLVWVWDYVAFELYEILIENEDDCEMANEYYLLLEKQF